MFFMNRRPGLLPIRKANQAAACGRCSGTECHECLSFAYRGHAAIATMLYFGYIYAVGGFVGTDEKQPDRQSQRFSLNWEFTLPMHGRCTPSTWPKGKRLAVWLPGPS